MYIYTGTRPIGTAEHDIDELIEELRK